MSFEIYKIFKMIYFTKKNVGVSLKKLLLEAFLLDFMFMDRTSLTVLRKYVSILRKII